MARKRLSMRKIKQILRQKWQLELSNRAIARSIKSSRDTVSEYLKRAEAAGLSSWEEIQEMDETELERLLFPSSSPKASHPCSKRIPDWPDVRKELSRKGVTLSLLWQEYAEQAPSTAYSYSQFCNLYKQWSKKLPSVMTQVYKGGELLLVDYAGQTVPYVDRITGEEKHAQIFVSALGASNFTYAEAQKGQDLSSWIRGHVNTFEFIGGVPEVVVPDNLKSGVTSPSYYEPDINSTYDDLSLHYGFAVIPARVKKPRDKAKVETAVQVVERWILAPLRNRKFFSPEEINEAMRPLLEVLNNRVMKHLEKSRQELFSTVDVPALKPLPDHPFEYAKRKTGTVGINYHVTFKKHYYSVPYTLIKEKVEIRASSDTVEIFHKGQRVASHLREDTPGRYTTSDSHMPTEHKRRKEKWSPERFTRWAMKIGPSTCKVITHILGSKKHPEQAYRVCIGILKLADSYDEKRLESACTRADRYGLYGFRHIKNILKNNMDKVVESGNTKATSCHENIRGSIYYNYN